MALAAVCGGAIGLAFEALLIRLLKPVLPAAARDYRRQKDARLAKNDSE
ncbi:hypothetical protein ISX56_35015 [Serratia ureilytica]|nr:hypothetical protein [Serratia ureilytica]